MIIQYGGDEDFSVLTYGAPNPHTAEFLNQQYANLNPAIFQDQSFIERAYQIYEQNNGDAAILRARQLLNNTDSWIDPNAVFKINDVLGMQTAGPAMQRWIMANPEIRTLYHDERCHGYAESYVDDAPRVVGIDHYDFRRVVDGVFRDDPDDPELGIITIFNEDTSMDSGEIDAFNQLDVLTTWDMLEFYLKHGKEDPTDVFGGEL